MNRTERTLRLLEKYAIQKNAAILDAGCGFGETLEALRAAGYSNLYGIEPDRNAADEVAQKGFRVAWSPISEQTLGVNHYDVILLLDVLEHVEKGTEHEVFRTLVSSLNRGGLLIVSVPYRGLTAWLDPANLKKILTGEKQTPWHRHYSLDALKKFIPGTATVVACDRFGIGISQIFRIMSAPLRWICRHGSRLVWFERKISNVDASIAGGPFAYHGMVAIRKK